MGMWMMTVCSVNVKVNRGALYAEPQSPGSWVLGVGSGQRDKAMKVGHGS